jgi:CBS domain-containing protein
MGSKRIGSVIVTRDNKPSGIFTERDLLSKYLATYYADKNVRVNSISPGGVYDKQPESFVEK